MEDDFTIRLERMFQTVINSLPDDKKPAARAFYEKKLKEFIPDSPPISAEDGEQESIASQFLLAFKRAITNVDTTLASENLYSRHTVLIAPPEVGNEEIWVDEFKLEPTVGILGNNFEVQLRLLKTKGAFTGVLVKPEIGDRRFILTVGHRFNGNKNQESYRYFWRVFDASVETIPTPIVQISVAPNPIVKFGGMGPDYALLEVQNSNIDEENFYVIRGEGLNSPMEGEFITCYSHFLGAVMVRSEKTFTNTNPKHTPRHYFFSYFTSMKGSSGAPVWQDGKLLGIVSAAGNFVRTLFPKKPSANQPVEGYHLSPNYLNGTQILNLSSVIAGEPEIFSQATNNPVAWELDSFYYEFSLENNRGDKKLFLIKKKNSGNEESRIELFNRIPIVVIERDRTIEIESDGSESRLEEWGGGKIRTSEWYLKWLGKDETTEQKSQLRFHRTQIQEPNPVYNIGKLSVLDGIGTTDIIDELPYDSPPMQQYWSITENPLELTYLSERQVIQIRYFGGLTNVYRRQLP